MKEEDLSPSVPLSKYCADYKMHNTAALLEKHQEHHFFPIIWFYNII